MDSAVHAINIAIEAGKRRVTRWEQALAGFGAGRVELAALEKTFAGFHEPASEFRTHLELATLAIAMKRRVIVLQAVEHAQLDPSNPFESFTRALKADNQRIYEMESRINQVLIGLSGIELTRSHGLRDFVFTSSGAESWLGRHWRRGARRWVTVR